MLFVTFGGLCKSQILYFMYPSNVISGNKPYNINLGGEEVKEGAITRNDTHTQRERTVFVPVSKSIFWDVLVETTVKLQRLLLCYAMLRSKETKVKEGSKSHSFTQQTFARSKDCCLSLIVGSYPGLLRSLHSSCQTKPGSQITLALMACCSEWNKWFNCRKLLVSDFKSWLVIKKDSIIISFKRVQNLRCMAGVFILLFSPSVSQRWTASIFHLGPISLHCLWLIGIKRETSSRWIKPFFCFCWHSLTHSLTDSLTHHH